jgi:sRNA-binding regulator protein Hfq
MVNKGMFLMLTNYYQDNLLLEKEGKKNLLKHAIETIDDMNYFNLKVSTKDLGAVFMPAGVYG